MDPELALTDIGIFGAFQRAASEIVFDVLKEKPEWGTASRRQGYQLVPSQVNVAVGLTGTRSGHFNLGMDHDVAKALAEAILGDPIPELDTAALGALCEFALLVCGHAKHQLQQGGAAVAVTSPLATRGDHADLLWYGVDPIISALGMSVGPIYMSLGIRQDEPSPTKLRVLVVDDMKFVRFNLSKLLTERGWDVVGEAENGEDAVQKYFSLRPDVVTMDISMPIMDGIDATRAIVGSDPDARILMISAAGQMDKVVEAIHAGAKDFVTKPFKKERVYAGIEGVVTGKTPVH